MRTLLSYASVLLAGLWLGSLVQLLMGVATLFRAFPRSSGSTVAVEAAPRLFATAERYHLVLAGLSVVAATAWRVAARRRATTILLGCAIAATALAAATAAVGRPMERLRTEGRSGTPEFRRLHGVSSVLHLGQTAFVLGGLVAATSGVRMQESQ